MTYKRKVEAVFLGSDMNLHKSKSEFIGCYFLQTSATEWAPSLNFDDSMLLHSSPAFC